MALTALSCRLKWLSTEIMENMWTKLVSSLRKSLDTSTLRNTRTRATKMRSHLTKTTTKWNPHQPLSHISGSVGQKSNSTTSSWLTRRGSPSSTPLPRYRTTKFNKRHPDRSQAPLQPSSRLTCNHVNRMYTHGPCWLWMTCSVWSVVFRASFGLPFLWLWEAISRSNLKILSSAASILLLHLITTISKRQVARPKPGETSWRPYQREVNTSTVMLSTSLRRWLPWSFAVAGRESLCSAASKSFKDTKVLWASWPRKSM